MSQANVELLRQANAAFNRGDIDAFLGLCTDDLVVEDLNNAPDLPPVVHGKKQARRVFAAWTDAFDGFVGEIEEYLDVDERHVGALVRYRGTQRSTGLEVQFRAVDMWEVRGSKLARGTLAYPDREAALDAVASPG
ncbi:MAG: nuclear transport factor 2 family protein [Thermoleophilaceae bacterium]